MGIITDLPCEGDSIFTIEPLFEPLSRPKGLDTRICISSEVSSSNDSRFVGIDCTLTGVGFGADNSYIM